MNNILLIFKKAVQLHTKQVSNFVFYAWSASKVVEDGWSLVRDLLTWKFEGKRFQKGKREAKTNKKPNKKMHSSAGEKRVNTA